MFTDVPYPRISMLWAPLRGDWSLEGMAPHDMVMINWHQFGLKTDTGSIGTATGFTPESIGEGRKTVARLREMNPDVLLVCDMQFYEYQDDALPEDHEWWLREDGKRVQFWPGTHRMDWCREDYRAHVVRLTAGVTEIGVDGVFYDNLRVEPEPWVKFLGAVREAVGDDFLLMANAGYAVGEHDFVAPFLNGIMYESGWSHGRTEWDETIRKMRHTETLLREPRISLIERFAQTDPHAGWPGDEKRNRRPPDDPAARRWSLCFALTVGDFYYLFSDSTSHQHDWYPEYDTKIGMPVAEGERVSTHVWQRRYDGALVVVNLPGAAAPHEVELPYAARDTLTDRTGTSFTVPPGDGCVLVPA